MQFRVLGISALGKRNTHSASDIWEGIIDIVTKGKSIFHHGKVDETTQV